MSIILVLNKGTIHLSFINELFMKKCFVVLALILVIAGNAQKDQWTKEPSIGFSFFLKDFTSLTSRSLENMPNGMGAIYANGLSPHFDFFGGIYGSNLDYPFTNQKPLGTKNFLLEGDAQLHYKILTDKHIVVPYLSTGVGLSFYAEDNFGFYYPLGGGLQFKVSSNVFVLADVSHHFSVSNNTSNNFQYGLTVIAGIKHKKPEVKVVLPPPPPVEKDTDGDGIVDSKDKCPTVKGIAKYEGCPIPDTDGDGINDEEDKCITVAGTARYQGCPIPDTDNDGINDEDDKCPNVPGLARYQGCPIPDTDGDGINDEEDKCPSEKGTVANHGCPEMIDFHFEAKNVQFFTGSTKLTPQAKAELDKGAAILIQHKTLDINIEGYTDNTGSKDKNLKLSQERADVVKAYLVSKGVAAERLTATGFGQESPIAENKTEKGRAENRRVEFKVKK